MNQLRTENPETREEMDDFMMNSATNLNEETQHMTADPDAAATEETAAGADDVPLLEIRHLEKVFGENNVLRDISFSVQNGLVLSFLGESGAGKSTLLRCINLLEEPSAGEILYRGENILARDFNRRRYRSRVGMVFQNYNLFANKNVLDNCTLGQISVLGRSPGDARAKAETLLEKVGMAEYAEAMPDQISGGQQQRVAIARALCMDPEVLLFDEPTSALDPKNVGEVLRVMRNLASSGMTMLVVTHEMGFARDVSDRILFMDDGRIVENTPAKAFFDNPQTAEARAFLRDVL